MHLVAAVALTVLAAMGPGSFTKATAGRDYYVYEPTVAATAPRPLVVFLHGCNQTAADAAIGTRWTELAEGRGFVVVFPEQTAAANGAHCWNWFLPEHQSRDAGEPAIVADITRSVIAAHDIDPAQVYVIGISAGADLAMIMGATHPDLFAAVGGFAGCAYATCADVDGVLAHAAQGERARVLPALLMQGTADPLNDPAMGETMATQWIGTNDLGDDGIANDSVPQRPTSVEHHGLDETALEGAGTPGDACVRNRQFPCASGLRANGEYPYSIEHHADRSGCDVVDFWLIHGLSHDYPGGDPAGSFTDPAGPDITTAAYDWFQRHRLGRPCAAGAAADESPSTGSSPAPGSAGDAAPAPGSGSVLPRTGPIGPVSGSAAAALALGFVMRSGCREAFRDAFWRPERITKP
jgi:poly(hydroxyalkanoate) depolymerase family esterase